MSGSRQPARSPVDERLAEAMAAHLCGEATPEQRHRLEVALARAPEVREHWEALSEFHDGLGRMPLPDAEEGFEEEMLARIRKGPMSPRASQREPDPLAEVVMIQGDVRRSAGSGDQWESAGEGESLIKGDLLRVGERGRALLRLPDRSELWINAGSTLRLIGQAVRLVQGEVLALMERQRQAFRILTADGEVRVVGTAFSTCSQPQWGTRVSVYQGCVDVRAGAQRRTLGPRRRVQMSADGGLGRTGRISAAEMRRLMGWTGPVRSASRASESRSLDTVRKETAMRAIKKIIGVAAVIGLAYLLFTQLRSPASESPGRALENVQTRAAEAHRIAINEPIQLSLAPRPGETWRQTALFQGQVTERDFFNADTSIEGEMRWVTEVQARAGGNPEEIILDHRATEAVGRNDLSHIHPGLHEQMRQEGRERAAVFARSSYVETLDPQGQQRGVMANIDFGPGSGNEFVIDPFILTLLSTPTGIPEGPLTEGTTWAIERPLIFNNDLTVTVTSTLDHFEEIGSERVAVIRSELECHIDEPTELFAERVPQGGYTRVIRESLDMTWSQEARHRLSDGRRLMSTGQFDFSLLAQVENGQVGDAQPREPQISRVGLEFRFEFATETESIR
jgi:ferric-dicitrate binding protein FerR (iron transport regulator)